MKIKAILVFCLVLISCCTVVVNSEKESSAVSGGALYNYNNIDSYYYNGNYVRITESIMGEDTGYKLDGTSFEYDLLKTEYHTFPDNNKSSWVLLKYFKNNELVYLDSRDFRSNNDIIEADLNDSWVRVITPEDDENRLNSFGLAYLASSLVFGSLGGMIGLIAVGIALVFVDYYIENGRSGSSDTVNDKIRSETITTHNLIITYVNDLPKMVNIGGVEAPVFDFCDETLSGFDAFVYYLVLKTPITDSEGNDTFIAPVAFDREIALSIMRIDSSFYNVWSAYSNWVEHLADDVYSSNLWEFHLAAQDMEMFDHYHGKSLAGRVSASKAFYGFAWGQMYVSDDPDNWQIDSLGDVQ